MRLIGSGWSGGSVRTRLAATLAVVLALLAWLWPIGIGGKMPVGGDVTQFFLGLMGFLSDLLHHGELPVWNDLWGFGFPGLAESQMGVFYPPHMILYGPAFTELIHSQGPHTEAAYVTSLVLHTIWGGLGAFWASRRMGVSAPGSALAAFAWSTGGFFVVHLAHPWGYTTGGWMPWAWGLCWSIVMPGPDERTSRFAPFLLGLVLVMQILPGHFQLAFQTQATLVVIVAWAILGRWWADLRRIRSGSAESLEGPRPPLRRAGVVILTMAAVFPMAAIQLVPTARLAGMASGRRDFEYLCGFAETPLHLVNLVAPGLFHRSTAWRPIVWNPFHTSPEECLAYIGLVPLFLAVMTIVREFRRDPAVRLLTILAVATLFLSLGPYVPGFRMLIGVPGFSFFRAPARWSLATSLALAILAGKGFDRWREWARPGRSMRRLTIVAAIWILAAIGLFELAIWSTSKPGSPRVAGWFDAAFRAMPWYGDPTFRTDPSFAEVMARARRPVGDPHLPPGPAPSVVLRKTVDNRSLVDRRGSLYLKELWETAVALILIAMAAGTGREGDRRARAAPALLLLLAFLDLWVLGRHRLLDVGPIDRLSDQSPVLARLAEEPRGSRIASNLGNLPILQRAAPIQAYRTLTLPAADSLATAAQGLMGSSMHESITRAALWATGARLRIFHPLEIRLTRMGGRAELPGEPVDDPALARWIYGADWVAEQEGEWINRFLIWRCNDRPARAWFLPLTSEADQSILDDWKGDPRDILPLFERATPLVSTSDRPDELSIRVPALEPGWVIISQLDDPQWQAHWISLDGQGDYWGDVEAAFLSLGEDSGGWQYLKVPFDGRWELRLTYEPDDLREGVVISLLACSCWATGAIAVLLRRRPRPAVISRPSEPDGMGPER